MTWWGHSYTRYLVFCITQVPPGFSRLGVVVTDGAVGAHGRLPTCVLLLLMTLRSRVVIAETPCQIIFDSHVRPVRDMQPIVLTPRCCGCHCPSGLSDAFSVLTSDMLRRQYDRKIGVQSPGAFVCFARCLVSLPSNGLDCIRQPE